MPIKAFLIAIVSLGTLVTSKATYAGIGPVKSVAAGDGHTCALSVDGGVFCWGGNHDGALGNNSTTESFAPVAVVGLSSGVASIVAGTGNSCAVLISGQLRCWGWNAGGQLGNNSQTNSLTPVEVSGLSSGVAAVTMGYVHTCALLTNGTVKCWGLGDDGRLGDGHNSDSFIPVSVVGLEGSATSIASGSGHTCALIVDGTVKCWGGQLGVGTLSSSSAPVTVAGLGDKVVAIAAGGSTSCALLKNGSVECWGESHAPQANWPTPRVVAGLPGVAVTVVVGSLHSCALLADRTIKCWGVNQQGALGNGTAVDSAIPVLVEKLGGSVKTISAGSSHNCVVLTTAAVQCWGGNPYGGLGDGTYGDSTFPITVYGSGVVVANSLTMVEFVYVQLNYYFMTSRANEINALDSIPGWRRTGQEILVLNTREPSTLSLNRYYFDQIAANKTRGSHFYTAVQSEKDVLTSQNPANTQSPRLPYNEGVDSYVYPPMVEGIGGACAIGQSPIYRLFRGQARFPDDPNHRFTRSVAIYNAFAGSGWDGEGVKFCTP